MFSEVLNFFIEHNKGESTYEVNVLSPAAQFPLIFEISGYQCDAFYLNRFAAIEYEQFYQYLAERGAHKFVRDYRDNLIKQAQLINLIDELDFLDECYQNQIDLTNETDNYFTRLLAKYGRACRGCMWQDLYDDLYPNPTRSFDFSVHPEIYWSGLGLEYLLPPDFELGDEWDADYWPEETEYISEIFADFLMPSIPVTIDDTFSWWSSYREDKYCWLEVISKRYYSTYPISLSASNKSVDPPNKSASDFDFNGDWSSLTSDELKLFRTRGAASEKLRRCLIALIHFNDYSATHKHQKWAINQSSLQRLSGCNRDAVKRFLAENELLVNRHNSHHGLTERHNTGKGRAGIKIEQVISW